MTFNAPPTAWIIQIVRWQCENCVQVFGQNYNRINRERTLATCHAERVAKTINLLNEQFLGRYRALLQSHPELASTHGELKGLLRSMPAEPESESERLHARHQWNMRCKHRSLAH